jgi:hypothetical protein
VFKVTSLGLLGQLNTFEVNRNLVVGESGQVPSQLGLGTAGVLSSRTLLLDGLGVPGVRTRFLTGCRFAGY